MKREAVSKINRKVSKQFPEFKGVQPKVKKQKGAGNGRAQYLLTYSENVSLPGGRSMRRILRVVADPEGRVLKMSTSR